MGRSAAIVTTMDEAVFRAYIAEFNAANFDARARFYADDVASTECQRPAPRSGPASVTALAVPAQVDAVADRRELELAAQMASSASAGSANRDITRPVAGQ
jgi:hypothetical protein